MYRCFNNMRGNSCSLLGVAGFVRGTVQSNYGMEGMVKIMTYFWIVKGEKHRERFYCPVCGYEAGFYRLQNEDYGSNQRIISYINRYCGVCGTRVRYRPFGYKEGEKQNDTSENR